MATTVPSAPRLGALSVSDLTGGVRALNATSPAKARAQAQDFEAQFLSSMFQNMFTGIGGEGPLGNSQGVGPWRSFLTQEYAKSFVKSGGIGLADHVYRALMAHQEARAS